MSTTSVGRGGEARAEAYLAERGYQLLRIRKFGPCPIHRRSFIRSFV